ncbi:MAG TPA: DsbA family oxidoreductase [Burkholderiales bacterium]|nr:DsbA family oxidoreductase [Burkholderiales bacterium]
MSFQIDIISDVVCPWCFIGKRNLERALEAWEAQHPGDAPAIRWHPFQLNPDLPAGGVPRKEYLERKFGGPARAKEIYARVEAAGKRAGIDFAFDAIAVQPNTIDAHRLLNFAGEHGGQDAAAEAIFRRYFLEGADLSSIDILADIAQQAGLDRAQAAAYLAGDADRDLIEEQDRRARAIGVEGVPFFIFNQRVALSGAQPPEVILRAMEQALQPDAALPQQA